MIRCGWCQSRHIDVEYVDIGVGAQQATAAECQDCGARQMRYDETEDATAEERRRGWAMGAFTEDHMLRLIDEEDEREHWMTLHEWLAGLVPAHARLDPNVWPVVYPARVRGLVDALVHVSQVLYEPGASRTGANTHVFETRCGLMLRYAAAVGETATCFQCLYLRPTKGTI